MHRAYPYILILILLASALILSLRQAGAGNGSATITPGPTTAEETANKPAPQAWAHQQSDIAVDPGAVFGSLPNGMRYVIYPNAEPPKRVSVRLHIRAGSLMEADDQQGVAHFLEHMMFNGTKNYSAEDLIPRMQRLGIAFGAHANAYTSFDETVYMLDLPDLNPETLELCFTVMRDFADGALLSEEEINKERGVILSEKLSRDSVNYRMMQEQFKKLLPDFLATKRFPIGTDEVIKNAPRQRFVDFYNQYYTPSRMTFVVVGDIDTAATEQRIRETFGSMSDPESPGKDPQLGHVTPPKGVEAAVFQDPELSSTDVSLLLVRPYTIKPDTAENRASELVIDIANSIIERRFERLSKEQDSPIAGGSASQYPLFNAVEMGSIDVTAAENRWQDAVATLETEFRKALEFGFTPAEVEEVKANLISAAEQRVKQKPTRKSEGIAMSLVKSFNSMKVFSTPETDLELLRKALESIDEKTCHEAFRKFWRAPGYHLILSTQQAPENTAKELLGLYEKSASTAVTPPVARAVQVFDYLDFGAAGSVDKTTTVEDLGITQLQLSNHVRINLKPTDFEKGRIRLLARIGSGKLSQPEGKPMLDLFSQVIFEGGGLGKHSNDDLQRILAGKNVSSSLSISEDAFILQGSTTPDDFLTQCRIMCASLTDPGFREEALWQFKKALPMLEQQLKHTPAGPAKRADAWLHGDDPRYSLASIEQLSSYSIDDAKQWLLPELGKGYLELSIVGDFDPDKILPDLLATFGALSTRDKQPPSHDEARKVKFPNAPAVKSFSYPSKIPQAIASSYWKAVPLRGNARTFRRLNIVADILDNRVREEIREKLGASYSPMVAATGSDALDNMGYLVSQTIGKPEDLELLHQSMIELADQLASKGATEDELERSLKPIFGTLEKTKRENSYWLGTVMAQCQLDPERLELARTRDADYKSISLTEINALAKKYLSAENALSVSIRSE